MRIEAKLAWASKRGEKGQTVIGNGFCSANNETEEDGKKLSYLFVDGVVEWVDGCEFNVSDFEIVFSDIIRIID
jgi:hypothetical protein